MHVVCINYAPRRDKEPTDDKHGPCDGGGGGGEGEGEAEPEFCRVLLHDSPVSLIFAAFRPDEI